MDFKKWQPLLELLLISAVVFASHHFFLSMCFSPAEREKFYYSLTELYTFFFFCSLVIVFVLILVKQKSIDYVGYSFLLLTVLKMVVAYFLLLPILSMEIRNPRFEKINFFAVFALFLTIETLVTARILNNKQ